LRTNEILWRATNNRNSAVLSPYVIQDGVIPLVDIDVALASLNRREKKLP
jgi:hypothetical protein